MLRGTSEALRARLPDDLRRRIAEGEFVHEFPGELAVAGEYAISCHTAREAISRLRREGSVTAQRGRPQRVVTPPEFVQPLGAVYSLFAAVEQPVKAALHRARLDVRADDIRRCGVQLTGGQETIRAVVPRPAERVLVGIADAQIVATLAIERLGWSHGHPVEWRHTRFGVTAHFPSRGDPAPRRQR